MGVLNAAEETNATEANCHILRIPTKVHQCLASPLSSSKQDPLGLRCGRYPGRHQYSGEMQALRRAIREALDPHHVGNSTLALTDDEKIDVVPQGKSVGEEDEVQGPAGELGLVSRFGGKREDNDPTEITFRGAEFVGDVRSAIPFRRVLPSLADAEGIARGGEEM